MKAARALAFLAVVACMPASWGANALLHPTRRPIVVTATLPPHEDVTFSTNDGIPLKGWLFRASAPRRGLIVYLHGVSDNRASGLGLVQRYSKSGWDVFTFDQRAHGESGGDVCTYGFREKQDVSRALDALGVSRAVVFGSSLGGAVALQAAAEDSRIEAVITQSAFCDLARIARERAPWFASTSNVDEAFQIAEKEGHFRIDDVSPLKDAKRIHVPVLLIHGADDKETNADHSRSLDAALAGPHELVIVPGAGHNDVLAHEEAWTAITRFLGKIPAESGDLGNH